jgi:hypothetical protein
MRRRPSPDSGCQGIAANLAPAAPVGEPTSVTSVHEAVRRLSSNQIVVVAGALAAALAGATVGAEARPAAALAGQTLGPRIDFDLAAHSADAPARLAARPMATRDS